MPVVSEAAFARRWRALSPAERAAFVADLWAAGGHETRIEGASVVAEPEHDAPRRLDCGGSGGVVVRAVGSVDRVLEPAELRRRLLYAIERERAEELFEAHFGRPLTVEHGGRGVHGPLHDLGRRRLAVGALALVLVVGLAAGSGALAGLDARFAPGVPTSAGGAVPTAVPTDQPAAATAGQPEGGGDLFRYPPGLGPNGVTDAEALAAAHRATLAGSAWSLRLDLNRSHDLVHPFVDWRAAEQTVVRESPIRYRYAVTGRTRLANGATGSVSYVDYGDGEANYRRLIGLHGEAFKRTALGATEPPGVFAAVSAAYVERYLSTTVSRVEPVRVDNTTRVRVVATGAPTAIARTVANYSAVAVVDRRGVVRRLTVEYTLLRRVPEPTPNGVATPYASPDDVETEAVGSVRFEMRWAEREPRTLERPSWYPRAVNATNGTDLEPWPNDPAV